ncbi:MAG: tetratricopeptide repeat protein [Spirochaetes bacterium]|nr:tetratricopeptide repeat protein [Spirochaetota bacterium]
MEDEFDTAIHNYNEAIKLNPNDAQSYWLRASVYINQDDFSRAVADINMAINISPERAIFYVGRGLVYKTEKNFDMAIADYSRAIAIDSKDGHIFWFRGIAYMGKKEFDKAIVDFNSAIELESVNAEFYATRAAAYAEKSDFEKAIADYSLAMQLDPDYAQAGLHHLEMLQKATEAPSGNCPQAGLPLWLLCGSAEQAGGKDYADAAAAVARSQGEQAQGADGGLCRGKGRAEDLGENYEAIAAMPEPQRVQRVKENTQRLESLLAMKPRQKNLVAEALVETAQDVMLQNRASLMNAMQLSDEAAKEETQKMVDSTRDFVRSSVQLISANIFNDELMNTLVAKSNGTIIQHMSRVYLNGLAFLSHYNKLVSTTSVVTKLRGSLDKNQREFYHSLLPHVHPDNIRLEQIFLGGMRAVGESDFHNWATGFLLHDIGKAAAIEYHEGVVAYDRDIVVEHVKVGYNAVMNKTNYPREAGLITGYHHEYYGDPAGYGYFRSRLDDYKKANPRAKHKACIAYDAGSVQDCQALAYFPAKVLEIIDVFDSVTDPKRKYREPLKPAEALAMMYEEFIAKQPKIDLILFDIFAKFTREPTGDN